MSMLFLVLLILKYLEQMHDEENPLRNIFNNINVPVIIL